MCRGYSPRCGCPGFGSWTRQPLVNVSPSLCPPSCLPTVEKVWPMSSFNTSTKATSQIITSPGDSQVMLLSAWCAWMYGFQILKKYLLRLVYIFVYPPPSVLGYPEIKYSLTICLQQSPN
ncbi:hypothetical protein ILYODFUR_029755 [Ilyodon furcidens]|uniref:Uncharacterized protein n=1 Tax=Ilyodon furcidens TaxID=33524 RepID=A0ABV0SQB5_9TELE